MDYVKKIENARKEIEKLQGKIQDRRDQIGVLEEREAQARRDYATAELDGNPSAKLLTELEKIKSRQAAEGEVIVVAQERIADHYNDIENWQTQIKNDRAAELDKLAFEKATELASAAWKVIDLLQEVNGIAAEAQTISAHADTFASAQHLTWTGSATLRARVHEILMNLKQYNPGTCGERLPR